MIVTNVNEIVQKLESFGLEVLIKDGELLIPSYVTHVSTAYGDLQLKQGSYEITYINAPRNGSVCTTRRTSVSRFTCRKTLPYVFITATLL